MKKIVVIALSLLLAFSALGCKKQAGAGEPHVEGTLEELMQRVYDNSGIEEFPSLGNTIITEENKTYFLGSPDVPMADGLASEAMISAIAHSVCLVRLPEDADVENAKKLIRENVNPNKWICVGVDESDVIVDNIGDLVILIMAEGADKLHESFLSLAA